MGLITLLSPHNTNRTISYFFKKICKIFNTKKNPKTFYLKEVIAIVFWYWYVQRTVELYTSLYSPIELHLCSHVILCQANSKCLIYKAVGEGVSCFRDFHIVNVHNRNMTCQHHFILIKFNSSRPVALSTENVWGK